MELLEIKREIDVCFEKETLRIFIDIKNHDKHSKYIEEWIDRFNHDGSGIRDNSELNRKATLEMVVFCVNKNWLKII